MLGSILFRTPLMTDDPYCRQCHAPLAAPDAECDACSPTAADGDRTIARALSEHEGEGTASPAEDEIPGYRIVRRIGEGGMGAVFLAEDVALGRNVAVKVVSARIARDVQARARFTREARLLATVEHPNIVRVYSFGTTPDERTYLVMEYVEGQTLTDRIRAAGTMPLDEAVGIARETVHALAAAWEKGIVHRDIKPSNILFDRRGTLKVADFGLAKGTHTKSSDDSLTQSGYVLGSPHYVAPEQAQGREADFRADIYSLGIMLFEMVTGRRPFEDGSALAVITQHLHGSVPSVRSICPELPRDLDELISAMTAKDPAMRPGSYEELARRLDDVGTSPATPALRKRIAPEISRGAIAVIGIVIVLAIGLIGYVVRSRSEVAHGRKDNRMVAAVAPFYGPDSDSAKEGRVMAALVEKAIVSRLGADVRVIGSDQVAAPVRDPDAARAVGERVGADVVIWGSAFSLRNETEITPSMTMMPRRSETSSPTAARTPADEALAELSGRAAPVHVQAEAPNQIELRRTSAEGIGDLVTLIAATYELHERHDARKAMKLLDAIPQSADTRYQRAICLLDLKRDDEAIGEIRQALVTDPQHVASLALLSDIDIRAGRIADAAAHLSSALGTKRPFQPTEGLLFQGKVYARERFTREGVSVATSNLLAYDPGNGNIVERYHLPGVPNGFSIDGPQLVIQYLAGSTQAPLAGTVRLSEGHLDRDLSGGSVLNRLNGMKAGWRYATNFMGELGLQGHKVLHPHFRYIAENAEPAAPKTMPELKAALEQGIAHDPTQPWYLFHLGEVRWLEGDHAGAEQLWTRIFAQPQSSTPYYEFSWMARHFEPLGHRIWADRAWNEAMRRRKLMRPGITGTTLIERMVDTPYVRAAAGRSLIAPEPVRQYLWLARARAMTGLCGEGDDLAALAWERYFESAGDHASAARERRVRIETESGAAYGLRTYALADILQAGSMACSATLFVLLAIAFVRARGRLRAITGWQRRSLMLLFSLVILFISAQQVVARRILSLATFPVGASDSASSIEIVDKFEKALAAQNTSELRFFTAVAHHLAGDTARAEELYQSLPDDERARTNLAALRDHSPIDVPSFNDVVVALRGSSLRWFVTDTLGTGSEGEAKLQQGGRPFVRIVVALTILFGIATLLVPAAAEGRSNSVRIGLTTALTLFIGVTVFMRLAATSRGKEHLPASGPWTAMSFPRYEAAFPFPPMPTAHAALVDALSHSSMMRLWWQAVTTAGTLVLLLWIVPVGMGVIARRRRSVPSSIPPLPAAP